MTIFRILSGLVSAIIALLFAAGAFIGVWAEFAKREKLSGPDSYLVHVGSLTLGGWQIHALYIGLALVALVSGLAAMRAFSPQRNDL